MILAAAVVLMLSATSAGASDATIIASRAGFLIGHAQRCGIEQTRLGRLTVYTKKLIAVFSLDDDDEQSAQTELVDRILASAIAATLGDPLPNCAIIRSQLTEFDDHRLLSASPSEPEQRLTTGHPRPSAQAHSGHDVAAGSSTSTTKPAITRGRAADLSAASF